MNEETKKSTEEELSSETELQAEELDAVAGGQTREHILLARQVGTPDLSTEDEPADNDGSEIVSDPGTGIIVSG